MKARMPPSKERTLLLAVKEALFLFVDKAICDSLLVFYFNEKKMACVEHLDFIYGRKSTAKWNFALVTVIKIIHMCRINRKETV